jgi:hypothetical protein
MDQIKKIQENKKQVKKETYKKIYDQFMRKITKAVENNFTQVFLETPVFVVGYPVFDRVRATSYVKRQLERAKFPVIQLTDCELYISFVKNRSKSKKVNNTEPESPAFLDDEFPTLMNLKKAANNLRNK